MERVRAIERNLKRHHKRKIRDSFDQYVSKRAEAFRAYEMH